jgi:hypothetical protein
MFPKYGLTLGADSGNATNFRIVNSGFTGCGSSGGDTYTIKFDTTATGIFAFNNVTGNNNGMTCLGGGVQVVNSIIAAKAGNSSCNDKGGNITDPSLIQFDPAASPKLKMPYDAAVDHGVDPGLQPAISTDFDGNLRRMGNGYDSGMQELR